MTIEKFEMAQFRTGDGRLLVGRVSSVNNKTVTLIAIGLGTSHRCKIGKVCKLDIPGQTHKQILETARENNLSAKPPEKDSAELKERRKQLRRRKRNIQKTHYWAHKDQGPHCEITGVNEFGIMGIGDNEGW